MVNTFLLCFNFVLYFLTFIVYQCKKKYFSIGSFVLLFYTFLSLLAIPLYNSPFATEFKDLTFFPFVYLYVALMMCFSPLLLFKDKKVRSLRMPDPILMNILSILLIVSFLIKFLTEISSLSIDDSLFDPMALAKNYNEREREYGAPGFGISNMFRFLSVLFSPVLALFFFYNIMMKNTWLSLGIAISIVSYLILSLCNGDRYFVFNLFMEIPFLFLLFRHKLNQTARRKMVLVLSVVGILLVSGLALVTIGRFGNNRQQREYLIYGLETYAAQNFIFFNNYGLDAGGIRYGENTANLVKRVLGLKTSTNPADGRLMYSHLKIDNSRFYTFVGDFTLDYGPFWGFIILMLMTIFLGSHLRLTNMGEYKFNQIILLTVLYQICVQGFSLFPYSFWMANIKLLFVILLYFLLGSNKRIRLHRMSNIQKI